MVRLALAGVVALTLLCAGVSEEVRKQPLVVPDESGRVCVYSRDVKSMKWWKLQIVKDYSVCNDFSRSRCIYDRELRHCIPKMLLDSDEDVVSSPLTVEECKKRCATVSCASRCEGMGFDDAPAGTKEKTNQKGMGKLKLCVNRCATGSCKDRCFSMGYVDFGTLKAERRRVKSCVRQCVTRNCVNRCFAAGLTKNMGETKLYRQLKMAQEKRKRKRKI